MKQRIEICEDGATQEGGSLEIRIEHPDFNVIKFAILITDTFTDVLKKVNDEIAKQPVLVSMLNDVEVKNE